MRTIAVRELKAKLSATLREVERGERIRVTSRGRVVADIVPAGSVPEEDWLETLVRAGRVTLPSKPRPTHPPRLVRGRQSASELILAERDDEYER